MDNLLQQGITAVKTGDRERAYEILTRAVQDRTMAEQAWLWLSAVVEADSERLFCLDNALRINPNNEAAQRKATTLRQKGVFPSAPMPPKSSAPVRSVSSQPAAPQSSLSQQPALREVQAPQVKATPSAEPIMNREEMMGLYRFAATEFASKKSPQVISKRLVDQGVTPAVASRVVSETHQMFKKSRREKYRKQMTRGLIWTVIGIVLTCATMAFASSLGGKSVLFYGAIIFGGIDFITGLVGSMSNK